MTIFLDRSGEIRGLAARGTTRQSCSTLWLALSLGIGLWGTGCAEEAVPGTGGSGGSDTTSTTSSTGGTGATAAGGTGGTGGSSLCEQDCDAIDTPACLKAVCNEGQIPGTIGECTVVPDAGAACDDGLFCTTKDACSDAGVCVGGPANTCDLTAPPCTEVVCNENSQSCSTAPSMPGAACSPTDQCQVNGVCTNGACVGTPKDCSFSPFVECNAVACNPANGACEPTPDTTKNGNSCSLSGDLCNTGKTCLAGACQGGTAKDCSALTVNCTNGVCNPVNGACVAEPVAPGGMCAQATDECNVGICDANSNCMAMPIANGTACNDFDSCTSGDACTAGVCSGTAVGGCSTYYQGGFETCPDGWTFGGDWECGSPSVVGPSAAFAGTGLIATKLASNYSNNQAYATTVADSPTINLTSATSPALSFYAWIDTESATTDGFNLKVSTNNGATYSLLTTVAPPYDGTIASETAWSGRRSTSGWQRHIVNLSAFAGQQIKLRFAFRSSASTVFPGVYIDEVYVAEASAIPLTINTSVLPTGFVNTPYSATLNRSGGSPAAVWSVVSGTNHAWLSLNPSTGALTGTPAVANLGPVSITVRVTEPSLPSNFFERTYNFDVNQAVYAQNFEAACPNGWTLGGEWECGTPTGALTPPGPTQAFSGTQCIATQIDALYAANATLVTSVATSPAVNLTGTSNPLLTFRVWQNTERSTFSPFTMYDGFNVKVSTDGGATFAVVSGVTPAYDGTLLNETESGWSGDHSADGWVVYQADLTPFQGQADIRIRFAFRSDGSVQRPGVYIDDVVVSD